MRVRLRHRHDTGRTWVGLGLGLGLWLWLGLGLGLGFGWVGVGVARVRAPWSRSGAHLAAARGLHNAQLHRGGEDHHLVRVGWRGLSAGEGGVVRIISW